MRATPLYNLRWFCITLVSSALLLSTSAVSGSDVPTVEVVGVESNVVDRTLKSGAQLDAAIDAAALLCAIVVPSNSDDFFECIEVELKQLKIEGQITKQERTLLLAALKIAGMKTR